jgi:hypothetical protein
LPYSPTLLALDGFRRALAGAGVGVGALAADRKALAVTQATVATQILQTLDVHRHFAAKIAFDLVVAVDGFADRQHFSVGQLVDTAISRYLDLFHDLGGKLRADTVDVLDCDDHAFRGRNVNTGNTCHLCSPYGPLERRF